MAQAGKPPAPFVITAELPPDIASWATSLRRDHFPPERNHLDAHVTLFHALPPSSEAEIRRALADMAARYCAPDARLEGVMKLGKGTALQLSSARLLEIRDHLANCFHGLLIPQDMHRPRLHITVQNKVSIEEAKALQAALAPQIAARNFVFSGLQLHIYRGGPWEFVKRWPFRGANGS